MNPTLFSLDPPTHSQAPRMAAFSDSNRAIIAMQILTQGAFFASIQALAAAALDGGDQEQALNRIDLVARHAAAEADRLANAVGNICTPTSI